MTQSLFPLRKKTVRYVSPLNPHALDFADADVIVAPVIEAGGFGVGVPGHALGDFELAAVGQIVGYAGGRKVWQPMAVSTSASAARRRTIYQTSLGHPPAQLFVLADRTSEQRPLPIIRNIRRMDIFIR